MNDVPDLPPEHDAVRRLLADARHRGATPPEVVGRLDEVLAGLVAERTPGTPLPAEEHADPAPQVAPVVDLGARRRRLASVGLLAAAAVVVAGVAIGQVLPTTGGSDDSAASDGGGASSTESLQDQGAAGGDAGGSSSQVAPQLKSQAVAPQPAPPSLSASDAGLADELVALRPTAVPRRAADLGVGDVSGTCSRGGTGPGRRVAVEVDGEPGLVVYRRPVADDQEVALYVCGVAGPVRTLTLPAP